MCTILHRTLLKLTQALLGAVRNSGARLGKLLAVVMIVLVSIVSKTSAAADTVAETTFEAVIPMSAADAETLMRKLIDIGLLADWAPKVREFLLFTTHGNSVPALLPTRNGHVCVASVLRFDIDNAMKFAPTKDDETRNAITSFIAAHEASHCKEILAIGDLDKEVADQPAFYWLEESLADHRARNAVEAYGVAGRNAIEAWERHRLFGFLAGSLDHWTTPLVYLLSGTTAQRGDVIDAAAQELLRPL